jgi:hypothetical protein
MRRLVLLSLTIAASAWAALLTLGGGAAIRTPWGRLSSRDPVRPLAIAILAGIALAFLRPRDSTRSRRRAGVVPLQVTLLIAAAVLIGGVRFGTFTASGSDPSGYVSESALWRTWQLTRPAPEWIEEAPWPDAARTAAPLGYMPGPRPATQVPTYPAGLPLLMAAAHAAGGRDAEYLVVPIAAALLVWSTYLLGARLSSPWGGLLAAGLLASSPPFLMWLVMPMGDIPVAACWTVALVAAMSGSITGSAGAGIMVALAILIRPNLVPLVALVGVVISSGGSQDRGRRLFAFAAAAAVGPVVTGLINWRVYGSPFQSGYGSLTALYSIAFIGPNIQRYAAWFVSAQTIVPLVGLIAPFCSPQRVNRNIVAAIVIGMPALTLILYLPYTRFEDWSYLRFLLPAYPALFAGLAVVAANVAERWSRTRWVRPAVAVVVGLLVVRDLDYSNAAMDLSRTEPRYKLAAAAAAEAPPQTVFVSFQHSGSLRYYTGHDVLRWDLMDSRSIDAALDYLGERGHRLYWVGDPVERETVRVRFAGTRFLARLDGGPSRTIADVQLVDLGGSSGS